ncbi:hypothetical protein BDQ17DRAFT_1328336 [Cyathus striatus]|nr:hypothetical protein BDQ17DRAFT_1328336 [Cyathus striatus]
MAFPVLRLLFSTRSRYDNQGPGILSATGAILGMRWEASSKMGAGWKCKRFAPIRPATNVYQLTPQRTISVLGEGLETLRMESWSRGVQGRERRREGTPEAEAFISRVESLPSGPGVNLQSALKPSIEDEAALRRLWATDKSNTRLANPYVGLVDVFAAPTSIRTTRARVISPNGSNLNTKYVCSLAGENRRKEGEACMVDSLDEFKKNWAIFTEGSLSQLLDWNNVIASGGSVLACLTPLPDEVKGSRSKRAVRKWYHTTKYPASDVDLFLWGMNAEQASYFAENKIVQIYEAVRDSVPWDVTCVRTKHTVSIHSQYPYRSIQIVLRLYSSPAEILAGFDVDAPCCAYDGARVSELGIDLEMNDYDVASLHIPYGPGWDVRRVEKLVYRTDLGMNSLFNPKNKGRRLHRHPAFFGTIEECMDDCCEHCPEPVDEDEKVLQKEEDLHYIRELTCKIVERLILAGASSSTANNSLKTIFHRAVILGRLSIVKRLLTCDPGVGGALNCPMFDGGNVKFPLVSAIEKRDYAMIATLLAAGAKIEFSEEDLTNAMQALDPTSRSRLVSYSVKNPLDKADPVAETCMSQHDDLIELMLALGAPVNVETKDSLQPYNVTNKRTLLDWVRLRIHDLSQEIASSESIFAPKNITEPTAASELTGWKKFLQALRKDEMEVQRKIGQLNEAQEWAKWDEVRQRKETKDYFVGVERLLVARGAKTWNELHPDNPMAYADAQLHSSLFGRLSNIEPNPTVVLDPESYRYTYLSNLSSNRFGMSTFVPEHLRGAYDDLFEAYYSGDNEKIEQLCLPVKKDAKSPSTLLDISVTVKLNSDGDYAVTGWTPLFAALAGRCWSTAKLIVAIAAAQYQSDEAEEMKPKKFEADNYVDSDDEWSNSDDKVKFVDIANRKSEVKTDVHPKVILAECQSRYVLKDKSGDGTYSLRQSNLLYKSVHESDLQAFVHIANLYQSLPTPPQFDITPYERLGDLILGRDNVDFLDEYIHRTGFGIDVKTESMDGEADDGPINVNDKNRAYLGLNVHGKKRSDLTRKNDPNASDREDELVKPLLWDAIEHNAKAAVEYLSSERPLAAFKFYASSRQGEERAERLRRISDPQKALPEMIGWKTNSLGESPLTAAIIGGDVDMMIDQAVVFEGPDVDEADSSPKFIGYNPILLAVATGRDPAVIDNLRSKSVSPAERDLVKGWNIYHFACRANNGELLAHLLAKIPRDVSEALLVQQSKHCMNTPLLIAVKQGSLRCVKLLLPYAKAPLTMRDAAGSIHLHAAVQRGFAEITQLLISAGNPETLYMENAVGNTVLEIASLVDLKGPIPAESSVAVYGYGGRRMQLGMKRNGGTLRYNVSELEHPMDGLWGTILELEGEKKVGKEEKIMHELRRFASTMEKRFKVAKEAEDARQLTKLKQPLNENMKDSLDVLKTFNVVSQAVKENPGLNREVVHLIDVQISVLATLEMRKLKSGEETESYGWYGQYGRYGGKMPRKIIPKEEKVLGEEEMRERGRSMVFRRVEGPMRSDDFFD